MDRLRGKRHGECTPCLNFSIFVSCACTVYGVYMYVQGRPYPTVGKRLFALSMPALFSGLAMHQYLRKRELESTSRPA